jgi:hypothetical protein
MEDQKYYIKISPGSVKSYVDTVIYTASTGITLTLDKECCDFTSFTESINYVTGSTKVRLSMSQIVTGATSGTSLMTGLTIPILITQNTVDIGYYSVFDGAILQKDVITNFLFSAVTGTNSSTIYLYNTSDVQYKKFLSESTFYVNWGDGTPIQTVTNFAPNYISHQYPLSVKNYKITLSGLTNFGLTIIEKQVSVPFTGTTIPNPKGTAYFIPQGGSWSGIPISYDYIFSGDSNTNLSDHFSSNYTTTPFLVTGFTKSSLNDLSVYKGNVNIKGYSYRTNQQITGTSGTVGIFYGSSTDGLYVSYNINGVDYYDFNDGTTIFVAKSSGFTSEWSVSSGLTKEETLINVISEPQIFSNVYIERGKVSAFEKVRRLNEVSTIGGLTLYGYKFFNVVKT